VQKTKDIHKTQNCSACRSFSMTPEHAHACNAHQPTASAVLAQPGRAVAATSCTQVQLKCSWNEALLKGKNNG
jgi:hypothetical protein